MEFNKKTRRSYGTGFSGQIIEEDGAPVGQCGCDKVSTEECCDNDIKTNVFIKDLSEKDFDGMCDYRQVVGNKYGETDKKRNNVLDAVEEVADLVNIIKNRLTSRLIQQQGYITSEQSYLVSRVVQSGRDTFRLLRTLDSKIPDGFKTDENGGIRTGVPEILREQEG